MSRSRHDFDRPATGEIRTLAWDYPAGWQVPEHQHGAHQLVYATSGAMTVYTRDGTWLVPSTWAVWVPAGVVHAIDIAGDVAMRTLYLPRGLARGLPAACRVVAVRPLLRELIVHAVERGALRRRVAADAHVMAVLLDQLRSLPAAPMHLPVPRDPRAARLAAMLRQAPSDRRTLAALAPAVGSSVRTLQRAFEHDTGMTFARWRQQLRFLEALRLLAAGGKVTTVALEVGYDSPSAFVTAFRRAFGTTPGKY